ncbi:MAG: response regulator [Gammaproteobacteria bacterium]|nr:response regulator [Gammaproteobacteria bacterium]MDH3448030.1 response regulator [Gammaproteobacteria bacterium]
MKKILIADDEPHVLRVLKMSLEKEGYEVAVCANGMEALARIEKQAPDILITDIQMPLMTGEELCRHIEEYMPERSFLIFVLTSRTEIEHREWSRSIHNLLFLEKPVSIRNLVDRLDGYFSETTDSWKVM